VARFADSITDSLGSPGIELFRRLVEDYEREHDAPLADIAAALALQSRDGEAFLMSPEPPPDRRAKERHDRPAKPTRGPGEGPKKGFATYRIAVGKRHKIGPGAIVGAIANEGGLHRSDFGHITIGPDFSLVELPAKLSDETLKALEKTRISGQLINLKPDRARESRDKGRRPDRGAPRRKDTG
jgi:ATP-dependent RNA helicase DeaD